MNLSVRELYNTKFCMEAQFQNYKDYHDKKDDKMENTKLYQYYLSHPNNIFLKNIIITKSFLRYQLRAYFTYYKIIKNNQIDIIADIINDCKPITNLCDDIIIICMIAIEYNRQDIMDILLSSNFNINSYLIINEDVFHYTARPIFCEKINVMEYTMIFGNLDMFKYLIENGGDIKTINNITSCKLDIFNFYLENIETCYLEKIMHDILVTDHAELTILRSDNILPKLIMILNHNPDIEKFNKYTDINFEYVSVEIISFLEEYDVQFNYDDLLQKACFLTNLDLVEYILKKGIKPSKNTIQYCFSNSSIKIIDIFVSYDVDFSQLEIEKTNEKHKFISCLDKYGVDKDMVITYLYRKCK